MYVGQYYFFNYAQTSLRIPRFHSIPFQAFVRGENLVDGELCALLPATQPVSYQHFQLAVQVVEHRLRCYRVFANKLGKESKYVAFLNLAKIFYTIL